jgi:hypothetical protein
MFDRAQTCYQHSKEALEDAQEIERAFEVSFHKYITGAKDGQNKATPHVAHPSSSQQESNDPHPSQTIRAAAPFTLPTRHTNLEAPDSETRVVWSIDDLPRPIPAEFHVLVQFFNEEMKNHGTYTYSWDLLKTPILSRHPRLLQECAETVGRKKPWDLYLKSAVKEGILTKMTNPRRVSLKRSFLLKIFQTASPPQVPAASLTACDPSSSSKPHPSSSEAFIPELPVTASDSEGWPPQPIHVPPHFYTLIEYLKDEMSSGTVVHRRAQLREPLLSRQPNLLIDAGVAGVSWHAFQATPIERYFQMAAELGIIRMNEVKVPATLWLCPKYFNWSRPPSSAPAEPISVTSPPESSAFPGIPAYFDVLVHDLRARRDKGHFDVNCETLFRRLLKQQPDVFLQAGTSHHIHPINQYLRKAANLGVVVIEGVKVALHSDYH